MQRSKLARVAGALGVAVLALIGLGALLATTQIASALTGFQLFLLGLLLAPLAFAAGIFGLWNTRKRARKSGKGMAWLGALAGLAGVALISTLVITRGFTSPEIRKSTTDLVYQVAYHPYDFLAEQTREFSPINDITSDLENPPEFKSAAQEMPDRDWSLDPKDAGLQIAVYPGVKTLHVGVEPPEAMELALEIAKDMGWTIRATRDEEFEFEAYAESGFFGFVDDIVVRMYRSDKCVIPSHSFCWSTAVDIRSRSRDGASDIGANATRICTFYDRLWLATGLTPDQSRHRCMQIGRFTTEP